MRRGLAWALAGVATFALPAWSVLAQGRAADTPYARRIDVAQVTALGRALFFDPGLSASGRVSCATCHDPAHAYGPPNGLAVQPGGGVPPDLGGIRATPSLRYLQSLPAYSEHFYDNDGDDSVDKGPTGGHMWDGRAGSAREQARLPLLSKAEMGNPDEATVVEHLRRAPYAVQLRAAFGADILERGHAAFDAATLALEVFQQSPVDFYPYSSRYDAVLRGTATLSPQEARGLALFNDPDKGNCAACHLSEPTPDGAFPLLTDFGHIAIGVPRNPAVPANADPEFHDLGLCGPLRTDLAQQVEDCGRFRTPSLRNVAVRQVWFHNGAMRTLEDAVRFYATRDTEPRHWYRGASVSDDLPARYAGNLNRDPPFGRAPGQAAALDEAEIAAIVAFLKTLTDADQHRP